MSNPEEKTAPPEADWTEEVGKRAPNILTALRFAAVPVFVWILVDPTPQANLWATGIFIFASLTDWLDGYIARIFRAESVWGKLMDPLADKILVMAALVMLAAVGAHNPVPAWMVVLMLAREMIVTGLRSLAAVQGMVVAASEMAKHKTAWTMIAIIFLLIDAPYRIFGVLIDFHWCGMVFLWLALVLSLVSGLAYAVSLRKLFFSEI